MRISSKVVNADEGSVGTKRTRQNVAPFVVLAAATCKKNLRSETFTFPKWDLHSKMAGRLPKTRPESGSSGPEANSLRKLRERSLTSKAAQGELLLVW